MDLGEFAAHLQAADPTEVQSETPSITTRPGIPAL